MNSTIFCSEPIAKMYEHIGLRVGRPKPNNLLQYIPNEIFEPTGSKDKCAIMLPKTFKQLKSIVKKLRYRL